MTRCHRHTALNLFAALAVACLIVGASASIATAASIGVNFEGGGNNGSPASSVSTGATAGIVPQTNWNNYPGSGGTLSSLVNSAGNTTAASVTVSSASGTYSVSNGGSPVPVGGDQQLNDGFIYTNGSNPTTVAISGIPYANYSVYVYELNDASGRIDVTTLGSTTYYGSAPDPIDANHVSGSPNTYLYTQTTSTNSGSPTSGSDYVLFTGLHGSSQSLTVYAPTSNGYISGIQISQYTPEPSSFILCGLGAAGLFLVARRRRKA